MKRKRKGVSYIEILVAIGIFSVAIVPLSLSLNNALKTTTHNRDYLGSLEYNAQLVEEIATLMPTKVDTNLYKDENGSLDIEMLESDISEIILARSESNASVKGVYNTVNWNGSSFDFSGTPIDRSVYRTIQVGEMVNNSDTWDIPITVTAINIASSEEISSVGFSIEIKGEVGENLVDEGEVTGKIQVKNGTSVDLPNSGSFDAPSEDTTYIEVLLHGEGNNPSKVSQVQLIIGSKILNLNGSGSKYTLENKSGVIKKGENFIIRLSASQGTSNLKDGLSYKLYRVRP